MFRERDPQRDLFETSHVLPPEKRARLAKSWAEPFRERALPLIREETFAPMFCADNGAPNKPVQVVLGVLILKEMSDLTDDEALERLEFDLLWQHALRLKPEDAHLCQKTLHNFRVGLLKINGGLLAFQQTTDQILEVLGTSTIRQRLDSTHITSNIETRTRLGLFCESIRVFLHELKHKFPKHYRHTPAGLRSRYIRDDEAATRYDDARAEDARRRIAVCARDLYRLVARFRGTAAEKLETYAILERLLAEQCVVVRDPVRPESDDDDSGDGGAPVVVKEPSKISGATLQSPHDPDATYSGHKGKGYEVQVAETCHEENVVEIITHVEVTPSCGSDATATIPVLEALEERGIRPVELVADTTYGSGKNAVAAERMGTELVSPVAGSAAAAPVQNAETERPLTAGDFSIEASGAAPTICPEGHASIEESYVDDSADRADIVFDKATCEACPKRKQCPVRLGSDARGFVLSINLVAQNIESRRIAEARGEFKPRYAIRAGIEATNSELKRGHGLGHLRVRGGARVKLAVYLKALACNVKRMVRALMATNVAPVLAVA